MCEITEERVDWKRFKMPFGKRSGWTMFQIYVNDYDYIEWILKNITDKEDVLAAAKEAKEHKIKVDPYSYRTYD